MFLKVVPISSIPVGCWSVFQSRCLRTTTCNSKRRNIKQPLLESDDIDTEDYRDEDVEKEEVAAATRKKRSWTAWTICALARNLCSLLGHSRFSPYKHNLNSCKPKRAKDNIPTAVLDHSSEQKGETVKRPPVPASRRYVSAYFMSAYFTYSINMSPTVKSENPDASFGDIGRIISRKFANLSDEERKIWDEKAAADRDRFDVEMADYRANALRALAS